MKIFSKNLRLLLPLLIGVLIFNSCKDEDYLTGGLPVANEGAIVAINNVGPSFFNLVNIDGANVGFSVVSAGEAVSSADMSVSYNGGDAVALSSLSSFPSDVNFPLSQLVDLLGINLSDVGVGDQFTFSLSNVVSASGTYGSGASLVASASCPSELAGDYTAVATATSQGAGIGWDDCGGEMWSGNLSIVEVSSGVYNITTEGPSGEMWVDLSMGAYYSCYGTADSGSLPGGDVMINDICGELSFSGASQWGEVFSFNQVEINGNDLNIGWTNDYGEGGRVVITSDTGWPEGLRF